MASKTPVSSQIQNRHTKKALKSLRREMDTLFGGAGLQNVFYVSPNGSNASAQAGSLTLKYATIQAAVTAAAAVANSLVFIGPGTFAESVLVPNGAVNLAIVGSENTIIAPPAGSAAIRLAPTTIPLVNLYLSNLVLLGTVATGAPAGGVLAIEGSALAAFNIFAGGGCQIKDVRSFNSSTGPALLLATCQQVQAYDCVFQNTPAAAADAGVSLIQSGSVTFRDCELGRWIIDTTTAAGFAAGATNRVEGYSCNVKNGISLVGDPQLELYGGDVTGNGLIPLLALAIDVVDSNVPNVGRVVSVGVVYQTGSISLDALYANVTAGPTTQQSMFSGGQIQGNVTVTDGAGAVNHAPRFRGVDIDQAFTVVGAAYPDIRECSYDQSLLVCDALGAIDRSVVRSSAAATIPAVSGAVLIAAAPFFTASGGNLPPYVIVPTPKYSVLVEPHGAPVFWTIDGKTDTAITAAGFSSAGAGAAFEADIVVVRLDA